MTTDPISAVLEGVQLSSEDLGGVHPWKASDEDIISACIRLVEDYGIRLQAGDQHCSDTCFGLGGDDRFNYLKAEDEEGNPVVLIELELD